MTDEIKQEVAEEEVVTMSKLTAFFKNLFQTEPKERLLPLIKQYDDEEMKVVARLYIVPDTFDAHGHTISVEDTHLMVKSLETARAAGKLKYSLFHTHETDTFYISKAWVQEYPCKMGDEDIAANTPMCEIQFKSRVAFEAKKDGTRLAGVSIGCKADLVDIDE